MDPNRRLIAQLRFIPVHWEPKHNPLDPPPAVIRQRAAAIRREWTDNVKSIRATGSPQARRYTIPTIDDRPVIKGLADG